MKVSEETQERAAEALHAAKARLESLIVDGNEDFGAETPARVEPSPIQITQQVFTDKLLISKCTSGQVKAVTRDLSDGRFHLDEIDFSDETWSHNKRVVLHVNRLEFIELLQQVQWQKVLRNFGDDEC